jgi:hypothetical protein
MASLSPAEHIALLMQANRALGQLDSYKDVEGPLALICSKLSEALDAYSDLVLVTVGQPPAAQLTETPTTEIIPDGFRRCSRCQQVLEEESFSGTTGYCKTCFKEYGRAYRDKQRALKKSGTKYLDHTGGLWWVTSTSILHQIGSDTYDMTGKLAKNRAPEELQQILDEFAKTQPKWVKQHVDESARVCDTKADNKVSQE